MIMYADRGWGGEGEGCSVTLWSIVRVDDLV